MKVNSAIHVGAITLVASILISIASSGLASSASDLSCDFAESYKKSKKSAVVSLNEIFSTADETTIDAIVKSLDPLPESFDEYQIAEVGRVNDLFIEHFIVLNSPRVGNVYFRIVYEKMGKKPVGVRYDLSGEANESLARWPFFQQPIMLDC
ncbi:hypothetical protein [Ruegeria sp. Ofav3-42]|uniref:hypothetical protein n=1 Tax=Ruegeria sp. Ofav3-42 TaxID=2917759 RepID=UPI001EF4C802|nr:hypothetical protein [Ruegeria sp. Ofav3-42]MCG7520379.1 hypothetical protein [Ruegeria sp. Ofav3-42]